MLLLVLAATTLGLAGASLRGRAVLNTRAFDCDGTLASFVRNAMIDLATGDVTGAIHPIVTNELE